MCKSDKISLIWQQYLTFLNSVDWSSVFTLREQQGYRGLSPQSNLSSRSSSVERDIPKYQYLSERSMSPYSDVSWTDQTVEEEVQYSPIVSDDEEEEECSQYLVRKYIWTFYCLCNLMDAKNNRFLFALLTNKKLFALAPLCLLNISV